MNQEREVDFQKYCAICKHRDKREEEAPCDECLAYPSNTDSRKPVMFKER